MREEKPESRSGRRARRASLFLALAAAVIWLAPAAGGALEYDREAIARGETAGGPIARLGIAERFHWLAAPASTIIQPSPVHTGLTDDPGGELARLVDTLVR